MGIFRKKKAAVLEESVIAAEKDDIKENDAAVKQMAKYQKKQVQSVMEEDLKMTQDIQRIHKEFDSIVGNMDTLDDSVNNFKNNFHNLLVDLISQKYLHYKEVSKVHSLQLYQKSFVHYKNLFLQSLQDLFFQKKITNY